MDTKEKEFIRTVKEYYKRHGRRNLPWRKTRDPYRIMVSEIMLQQTQVERVVAKYEAFLAVFPDVRTLAGAPLGAVLRAWQGLGYNRRAKMLHECAKQVVMLGGTFPQEYAKLLALPGIGPYTAGAVMAFAFNMPVPIIETNIRSVYLHHFFPDSTDVSDRELMRLVERTLDVRTPRSWYAALMDYGTYVKKNHGNPNSRSRHHVRQTIYKGSDRQIRGAILTRLAASTCTRAQLHIKLPFPDIRIDAQLEKLGTEKLIVRKAGRYSLPE
jgi:A/G-specific adenine glycosylase